MTYFIHVTCRSWSWIPKSKKRYPKKAFVKCAKSLGIDYFDTAPLYGDGKAEVILGKSNLNANRIITKYGLSKDFGIDQKAEYR